MGRRKKAIYKNNYKFIDSAVLNSETYFDYLERFKKVALSIFEWVNLPKSMNARWLEFCLFEYGQASLLFDNNYGFINTKCTSSGDINIYGLPNKLNCYSYSYSSEKRLYTGLYDNIQKETDCILVMNNWDRTPTLSSMELFAYRLYTAERVIDTNLNAQRTPVLLLVDEKQRTMLENMYSQYEGNRPFIFGDKDILNEDMIKAINTDAPYVADKIIDYKKEIWNEALTFLRN